MLPPPQPAQELLVSHITGNAFNITVHSEDARSWVENNAPKYGKLYSSYDNRWQYTLFVVDGYNAAQVMQYFLSYNNKE